MKLDPGSWYISTDVLYESNHVSECLIFKHGRNDLITSQGCEPLTSARETTNNDNGSQGTSSTIYEVLIDVLMLNTHRII